MVYDKNIKTSGLSTQCDAAASRVVFVQENTVFLGEIGSISHSFFSFRKSRRRNKLRKLSWTDYTSLTCHPPDAYCTKQGAPRSLSLRPELRAPLVGHVSRWNRR